MGCSMVTSCGIYTMQNAYRSAPHYTIPFKFDFSTRYRCGYFVMPSYNVLDISTQSVERS